MRVLVAPDKFKDALSVRSVCDAIERGIQLCDPAIRVRKHPLADGGEGTAEILTHHHNGQWVQATVHDPLFRKIEAHFGLSQDGKTAFIDMAGASGLQLLKPEERNCFHTTSYGTGELIQKAIAQGATHVVLGIGGSATHDLGIGLATALGYKFFDVLGNEIFPKGKNLEHLYDIKKDQLFFDPAQVCIEVACDVQNPLLGSNGSAHVFAAQKGASGQQVAQLEAGAKRWNEVVEKVFGQNMAVTTGAGAAGGVGAAMMVLFNAALKPGVELVMAHSRFEEALEGCDLVITGEGQIDDQNLSGKVLKGVANKIKGGNIPLAAFCGSLKANRESLRELGLTYANAIVQNPVSLEEALEQTEANLEDSAFYLAQLVNALLKQ